MIKKIKTEQSTSGFYMNMLTSLSLFTDIKIISMRNKRIGGELFEVILYWKDAKGQSTLLDFDMSMIIIYWREFFCVIF